MAPPFSTRYYCHSSTWRFNVRLLRLVIFASTEAQIEAKQRRQREVACWSGKSVLIPLNYWWLQLGKSSTLPNQTRSKLAIHLSGTTMSLCHLTRRDQQPSPMTVYITSMPSKSLNTTQTRTKVKLDCSNIVHLLVS